MEGRSRGGRPEAGWPLLQPLPQATHPDPQKGPHALGPLGSTPSRRVVQVAADSRGDAWPFRYETASPGMESDENRYIVRRDGVESLAVPRHMRGPLWGVRSVGPESAQRMGCSRGFPENCQQLPPAARLSLCRLGHPLHLTPPGPGARPQTKAWSQTPWLSERAPCGGMFPLLGQRPSFGTGPRLQTIARNIALEAGLVVEWVLRICARTKVAAAGMARRGESRRGTLSSLHSPRSVDFPRLLHTP